jgi:DNA (cytosine-5)-methyltransferase 1
VNEKPTHLDLFSGIGGFALAAGWAGFETVGFCDNEPYAQAVLKKHWPNVQIHGDIKALKGSAHRGVTLLTGGFPCQPFSNAGKRRGKDDDRYLWPQMLRVIQEARPAWIVGENVVGIIGLALDQVCSDLEAEGYEVEPIIIPACGVDAPHRRNRVWIIAKNMADSSRKGLQGFWRTESNEKEGREEQDRHAWPCGNSKRDALCWVVEPEVGRVANGIPNRTHRLKGLGNAIVPQVAYQIIKGIRELI